MFHAFINWECHNVVRVEEDNSPSLEEGKRSTLNGLKDYQQLSILTKLRLF